jgi:ribosomal protein S18 acetylase RimI-like enzyme
VARPGDGSHIASASYMVDPAHSGRGVGRALCEDSLEWARTAGFQAMVFNAVVETNVRAVRLYESVGFKVVGTVPEGFRHATEGHVGLHMMHQTL